MQRIVILANGLKVSDLEAIAECINNKQITIKHYYCSSDLPERSWMQRNQ
jgi:hypothetical protein